MPQNGMNTGSDYSFSYYDGLSGTLVNLGDVQSVSISAGKHAIKSDPYNGTPRFGYIGDGYAIHFSIVRGGPAIEDFMLSQAAAQNSGAIVQPGVFNETINNPDGSISHYQYTNFVAFLTDQGDVSREKVVTLKMEGMASDKIKIA